MSQHWTAKDIPDLEDVIAVVTGANSGIGFEITKQLAGRGALVVMACRDLQRAKSAAAAIYKTNPDAALQPLRLDLADLTSVRTFAKNFKSHFDKLTLLINNAGIMVPPLGKTADGFELQFGVNHLGHFALTGRLLDVLLETPGARIVTLSSGAHRMGEMDFANLHAQKAYKPWAAYGQSKLANLLFTFELQRRLESAGAEVMAVAAHPGYTGTNLQQHSGLAFLNVLAQNAEKGALPALYAATAPSVRGGDYFGPDGFAEMRGYLKRVDSSAAAKDAHTARRLWEASEILTDSYYDALELQRLINRPVSTEAVLTH